MSTTPRLTKILEGETPYDNFIRWKPAAEKPLGGQPDHNDDVRLTIRPFTSAEVFRQNKKTKLNIAWDKDRGQGVSTAPWLSKFQGDRVNDHHLSLAEKRVTRGQVPSGGQSRPSPVGRAES